MVLPDIDDISTYGNAISNYSPVVDPTTDEDASWRNKYVANVAMSTWTQPRAIVSFVGVNGGNPTDPVTGLIHAAVWGNSAPYKPTLVRSGEGIWDITWPATVDSALTSATIAQGGGIQHSVNFRRAIAQCQCADGTLRHVRAEVTGANVVRVRGWTSGGTLDDLPGQIITVLVW